MSLLVSEFLVRLHYLNPNSEEKRILFDLAQKIETAKATGSDTISLRDDFVSLVESNSAQIFVSKQLSGLGLLGLIKSNWAADTAFNVNLENKKRKNLLLMLEAFRDEGLECVALKGGLFAQSIYNDFSYKRMNDFDFWIPVSQRQRVLNLLSRIGFISFAKKLNIKEQGESSHHSFPYYSEDKSLLLGVHWRLSSNKSTFDFEDDYLLREPKTFVSVDDNIGFFRFSWATHLLHLCLHLPFYKTGIRELADIINLLRLKSIEIDWTLFLKNAHSWSAESACYRVLQIAQTLHPHQLLLPTEVLNILKSKTKPFVLTDTSTRTEMSFNLIRTRSTLLAKIEKAFAYSLVSYNYQERLKSWAASWSLSFFTPVSEVVKIDPLTQSRFKSSRRVLQLLMQDHGRINFCLLTVINLGMILLWSIRRPFGLNPKQDSDRDEILQVLKKLE